MTTRQVSYRLKSEGKAELKRDFGEVGQAGASANEAIARAQDQAAAASRRLMAATDEQRARYRQLAQATNDAAAAQAKFNAILNVRDRPGRSAREAAEAFLADPANDEPGMVARTGLTRMQRMTLAYTASDVFASAASGMSPGLIALQQGPQVLQAFALEGGKASEVVMGLTRSVGGLSLAVLAGVAAWLRHKDAMADAAQAAEGVGAAAGLTGDQLVRLAEDSARAGDVSTAAAREMAATYVETGRIGGEVMSRLIGLTKNYAFTTSQDAKTATEELAKAMADPARGMETLNSKLNFLDDATYRHIQTLISQNQVTEAQMALLDALGPRLLREADHVDVFSRAVSVLKRELSETVDFYGKLIDKMVGGGPLEQQIARLLRERDRVQPWVGISASATAEAARLDREIARLQGEWRRQEEREDQARTNQIAADARAVRDRINPGEARLRELQQQRSVLQHAISTPGAVSDLVAAARDLEKLDKEIAAVKAGYASADAQASAFERSRREAARSAREAAREEEERIRNLTRREDLRLRGLLEIARVSGDKSGALEIERQVRLRQVQQELESTGLSTATARIEAERQVGREMQAQYQAMLNLVREEARGLVTMQERLRGQTIVFDENAEAMDAMGWAAMRAFDTVADRAANVGRSFRSLSDTVKDAVGEIVSELIRLVAINPLKNALFGGLEGYRPLPTAGGGFFGSLLKGLPGLLLGGLGGGYQGTNFTSDLFAHLKLPPGFGAPGTADGTENWQGGWHWVGERGPELRWSPPGTKVLSNPQSMMAAQGGRNLTVIVNAEGAVLTETVKGWVRAGVEEAVGRAGAEVTPIVNDALSRRWVRSA